MPDKKRTFRKRLFWIAAIIVAIPFAAQLALQIYLNSYLSDFAKKLEESSGYKYRFHFDKVSYRILSSSVYIAGFKAEANDSLENRSAFSSDHISVSGIGLVSYLFHNKIVIDRITINGANINVQVAAGPGDEKPDSSITFSPYEAIRGKISSVFIRDIDIGETAIRYFDHITDTVPSLVSANSSLLLENLLIDSTVTYKYKRWFDADKFIIISKDFKYTTKDSLYTFHFSKLLLSYRDSLIEMDSVKMIPNFSESQFGYKKGSQTDRIDLQISNMLVTHISVKGLMEKRKVITPYIRIQDLQLRAYRDKKVRRIEKRVATMQQLVKSIPLYLNVDSITVSNGFVQYKELAPESAKPGYIYFDKIQGTVTNITNDTLEPAGDLMIRASARLMGHGEISTYVSFPYDKDGLFEVNGRLGTMDMKKLNVMLENNAAVSIREGTIKDATFAFTANKIRSKGTLVLRYDNLSVDILNKETRESSAIKEMVSSALANNLIIINDNPEDGKDVRKAAMGFERNPNRFIFNYFWKTIFSGIKETVGMNRIQSKSKKEKRNKK